MAFKDYAKSIPRAYSDKPSTKVIERVKPKTIDDLKQGDRFIWHCDGPVQATFSYRNGDTIHGFWLSEHGNHWIEGVFRVNWCTLS